jgi:hypothetical protein
MEVLSRGLMQPKNRWNTKGLLERLTNNPALSSAITGVPEQRSGNLGTNHIIAQFWA